jgi:DNA (cytosine-5)-methyltransferase 1
LKLNTPLPIRYGSVCSGIEAASLAWRPLGWRPAWFAEIDPFACAVLAHHYPSVPNLGDMSTLAARVLSGEVHAPDILVGGTPCQSFSLAGARHGLADPRGSLTLKFSELLDAVDHIRRRQQLPAAVLVWENVPGVLSDRANAFGAFLGALAGEGQALEPPGGKWTNAGYVSGRRRIAWRVLDAQYCEASHYCANVQSIIM